MLHDTADIFLESAKIFNYIFTNGKKKWAGPICDGLFTCFAIVFAYTRLYLYPRYIITSLFYEGSLLGGGWWPGLRLYFVLLMILQILHAYWFFLICKMVYRMFTTGIEKDERSDDEGAEDLVTAHVDSDDDEDEAPVVRSTRKPAAKSAAKPTAKPAAKPAAKSAAKPAPKRKVAPAPESESESEEEEEEEEKVVAKAAPSPKKSPAKPKAAKPKAAKKATKKAIKVTKKVAKVAKKAAAPPPRRPSKRAAGLSPSPAKRSRR
jgi:hypothetical protein